MRLRHRQGRSAGSETDLETSLQLLLNCDAEKRLAIEPPWITIGAAVSTGIGNVA
jgi:hypothetical protein